MTAQRETTETRTRYVCQDGSDLPLLLWGPAHGEPTALVVLFHGGGWQGGSPDQFALQCRLLASHRVLAVSAGYRLIDSGAATLSDCLDDARAAVEHARTLAPRAPLFLGGGSAGGQLALTTALTATAADPSYAGLVLFNPVVDLCDQEGIGYRLRDTLGLTARTAAAASPVHLTRPGAPPAIIFHGSEDEIVPIAAARRFRDAMRAAGSDCRLLAYEGAPHGFFNPGVGQARWFEEPASEAVAFVLARSAPLSDPRDLAGTSETPPTQTTEEAENYA